MERQRSWSRGVGIGHVNSLSAVLMPPEEDTAGHLDYLGASEVAVYLRGQYSPYTPLSLISERALTRTRAAALMPHCPTCPSFNTSLS